MSTEDKYCDVLVVLDLGSGYIRFLEVKFINDYDRTYPGIER